VPDRPGLWTPPRLVAGPTESMGTAEYLVDPEPVLDGPA
jgi:hypothetical protein